MVGKTAMSGKDSVADYSRPNKDQQHTLTWLHVLSLLSDFCRIKRCTAEFAQQQYLSLNIEVEELDVFVSLLYLRGCMNAKILLTFCGGKSIYRCQDFR